MLIYSDDKPEYIFAFLSSFLHRKYPPKGPKGSINHFSISSRRPSYVYKCRASFTLCSLSDVDS